MSEDRNKSATDRIIEDVTDYVDMRIANAKLATVENLSVIFASALRLIIFVVMCGTALILFASALVHWLGVAIGSQAWATVIVGGTCLIIGVVVYYIRRLFVNKMVRIFSKMVFAPGKKHIEDEQNQ